MDEKMKRTLELASRMPDMTYVEWKLLSQFIDNRFRLVIDVKKKEAESSAYFSEAMELALD